MRVAILSYHTCPLATLGGKDTGGMNVYVKELSRQLGRMNIHADVFTRSQDEHVPHVLHDIGYGNRIVHIKAGPEIPLSKYLLAEHINEFVEGIIEFTTTKNLEYDLINSHYWMSGIAGLKLINKWNVPIVQMFHTLGKMKARVARAPHEDEGDYRYSGEKQVIEGADRIIASTSAEKAQLQWLYHSPANKIEIIPPGVDTKRFYPIDKEEAREVIDQLTPRKIVLFVGRIEPLKGIDNLIHAFSIIEKERTIIDCQYCLIVIGGDPENNNKAEETEMNRLIDLSKKYDLMDVVTFLGKRDQDKLPYYYNSADVVVVPSHYESFGMVALEAMACGTPVIASETGGLAFLVQDGKTGFTVPVNDPNTLAQKLLVILEDQELNEELGRNAVELAKNYDWELIVPRIVGVFNEVIS